MSSPIEKLGEDDDGQPMQSTHPPRKRATNRVNTVYFTCMCSVLNKFSARTTVKHRKTAVCSRRRTVISLDFVSTALLRYGPYPYSTAAG